MIPIRDVKRAAMALYLVDKIGDGNHPLYVKFESYMAGGNQYLAPFFYCDSSEHAEYICLLNSLEKFCDKFDRGNPVRVPDNNSSGKAWDQYIDKVDALYSLYDSFRFIRRGKSTICDVSFDKYFESVRKRAYERNLFDQKCIEEKCNEMMRDLPKWLKRCFRSFSALFKLIDYGNLKKYSSLCSGTLKDSQMSADIMELKVLTDRILNYTPQLTQFVDRLDSIKKEVYSHPWFQPSDFHHTHGATPAYDFSYHIFHDQ